MPAKDLIHEAARNALIHDGWTITDDPYTIQYGDDNVHADLAAEQAFAAERGLEKIAVEVKGFRGPSPMTDFQRALGQFLLYRDLIDRVDPDRKLFLAIPAAVFENTLRRPIYRPSIEAHRVAFLVFRPDLERIVRWIP